MSSVTTSTNPSKQPEDSAAASVSFLDDDAFPLPPRFGENGNPNAQTTNTTSSDASSSGEGEHIHSRRRCRVPIAVFFSIQMVLGALAFGALSAVFIESQREATERTVTDLIRFSMASNTRQFFDPIERNVLPMQKLALATNDTGNAERLCKDAPHDGGGALDDFYECLVMHRTFVNNDPMIQYISQSFRSDFYNRSDGITPKWSIGICGVGLCASNVNETAKLYLGPKATPPMSRESMATPTRVVPWPFGHGEVMTQFVPSLRQGRDSAGRWYRLYPYYNPNVGVQKLVSFHVPLDFDKVTGECTRVITVDLKVDYIDQLIQDIATTSTSTVVLSELTTETLITWNVKNQTAYFNTTLPAAEGGGYKIELAPMTKTSSELVNRATKKTLEMYEDECGTTQLHSEDETNNNNNNNDCALNFTVFDDGDNLVASSRIRDAYGFDVLLLEIVPKDHYYGELQRSRTLGIFVAILASVIGSVITVVHLHIIVRPLKHLKTDLHNVSRLSFERNETVVKLSSYITEVDDVAEAAEHLSNQLLQLKRFVPDTIMRAGESVSTFTDIGSVPEDSQTTFVATNPLQQSSTSVSASPSQLNTSGASSMSYGAHHQHHQDNDGDNHFVLSAKLMNPDAKKNMRLKKVSLVWIQLTYTTNESELVETVEKALGVIIRKAMKKGGVAEEIRPDSMLVSFNAHQSIVNHESVAIEFAVEVVQRLERMLSIAASSKAEEGTKYVSDVRAQVAVDTSPLHVGVISAERRSIRTVFGDGVDTVRQMAHLGPMFIGTDVIISEHTKRSALRQKELLLVDRVLITPRHHVFEQSGGKKHAVMVYAASRRCKNELANEEFASLFRDTVTAMSQNDPEKASEKTKALKHLGIKGLLTESVAAHLEHWSMQPTTATDGYARQTLPPWDCCGQPVLTDHHEAQQHAGSQQQRNEREYSMVAAIDAATGLASDDANSNVSPLDGSQGQDGGDGGGGFLSFGAVNDDDEMPLPTELIDKGGQHWFRGADPIAAGASGKVYRGVGENGSIVAIKVIALQSFVDDAQVLKDELILTSQLRHPNITSYLSWCVIQKAYVCLFLEWMTGGALNTLFKSHTLLRGTMIRRVVTEALEGLAYLHENGIVHSDIKPHNILVAADGTAKLADFGSSLNTHKLKKKQGDGEAEEGFSLRGTTYYMAPEVARGELPTPASDMWSLGITIVELLTGSLPWTEEQRSVNSYAFISRLGRGGEEMRPQIPLVGKECEEDGGGIEAGLHKLISSCLQLEAKDRPSANALLRSDYIAV